ncbi:hypothetical protein FBU30_001703 [Linnemannia zychae]|nr:hypothetical protein FBU30_001703 [Linnemannia zychae]
MESSNHSSNDDIDNPFIVSSNQPSLKQETQISSPSTIDSATLSDLVQQVTTMREQLAALLAEKESQRFYSTVTSISPGGMPPPPPPPPPLLLETPSSKLRTPPVNEATRSMQRVLNELSTSKIHLRKTGSPFLSRISAAVDSSPNSKFSRVIFKSRMDKLPDKFSENSNIGSIAPLSLVSHLRGSNNGTNSIDPASRISDADVPETPTKRKSRPIYQEPEEEKVVLDWPSPRTVKRADSRLDIAAKEISHTKYNKKLSVQAIGNNGVLKIKKIERGTGNPGKLMNSGLTEAKSSQVLESKRKFNYHSYHNTETEVKETVSKSEKNSEVDIQESLVGRDEAISDNVFGRERSGPRLENSNKRPKRPTRPQSAILSRSMTDPTTINSSSSLFTTIPMTTDADKERERQWFLESDIDGWKVAQ